MSSGECFECQTAGQGRSRQKCRGAAGAALLLVSGGLILYGLTRGEAAIVLNKAVNICLECIGLG